MSRQARALTLAPLFAVAVLLSACDEDEQGRVLRYEKGTYLGPQDQELDQETLDALRQRARRQSGN